MGLILNIIAQELRSLGKTSKNTSYDETGPDDSDMQFGGYCYNHSDLDAPSSTRPSKRRGLFRQRKEDRHSAVDSSSGSSAKRNSDDSTSHPVPAYHPRALGTSLASSSATRNHAPSSYDSQEFYTNPSRPRGYSVSGGPIYDYADEYHPGALRKLHSESGSARQPFGGELQQWPSGRVMNDLRDSGARTPSP